MKSIEQIQFFLFNWNVLLQTMRCRSMHLLTAHTIYGFDIFMSYCYIHKDRKYVFTNYKVWTVSRYQGSRTGPARHTYYAIFTKRPLMRRHLQTIYTTNNCFLYSLYTAYKTIPYKHVLILPFGYLTYTYSSHSYELGNVSTAMVLV